MVCLNSLSKILKFIEEKHLKTMKPWSERFHRNGIRRTSNGFNTMLVENVRKLLQFISGNDMIKMLKGVVLFIILFYLFWVVVRI